MRLSIQGRKNYRDHLGTNGGSGQMCRHIRDLRHVRVDNDSNEDPENDEELYVVLPEDEANKMPMLRRSTRERKAPDRYSP